MLNHPTHHGYDAIYNLPYPLRSLDFAQLLCVILQRIFLIKPPQSLSGIGHEMRVWFDNIKVKNLQKLDICGALRPNTKPGSTVVDGIGKTRSRKPRKLNHILQLQPLQDRLDELQREFLELCRDLRDSRHCGRWPSDEENRCLAVKHLMLEELI
jgi:hypothetical protein